MRVINNPAIVNVGQGKRASLIIAPGETLAGITLAETGTSADIDTDIDALRCYVQFADGDKLIYDATGAQSRLMEIYKKGKDDDLFAALPFYVRDAKDPAGALNGVLGTIGTNGVRWEIDINAAAPSDIALTSRRQVLPGVPLDADVLVRQRSYVALSASGDYSFMLPAGEKSAWSGLQRLYLFDSADKITRVQVLGDGIPLFDQLRAPNVFDQQDAGLVPTDAEMVVVDFTVNGFQELDAIDMRRYGSVELILSVSAATNITRFMEGLADVRRL